MRTSTYLRHFLPSSKPKRKYRLEKKKKGEKKKKQKPSQANPYIHTNLPLSSSLPHPHSLTT